MKVVARAAPAALVLGAFLCADQVQVAAFSLSSSRSTSMARRKRIIDDSMKHGMSEAANKTTDTIVLNHLTDTSDMLSGERAALSKAAEKLSAVMANITSENKKEMKIASNDTKAKMQNVSSMLTDFVETMEEGTQEVLTQLGDANKQLQDFSEGFQTGITALEQESNDALTAVHMGTQTVADQEEQSADRQLQAAEDAVNALFGREPPEPEVEIVTTTEMVSNGSVQKGVCGCDGKICYGTLSADVKDRMPDLVPTSTATTAETCMEECEASKCCTGYMLNEGANPLESYACVLFTGEITGVISGSTDADQNGEPDDKDMNGVPDGITGAYARENMEIGVCKVMERNDEDLKPECSPGSNGVSYVEVADGILNPLEATGLCGCGEELEEVSNPAVANLLAAAKAKEGACQTWRAPCRKEMSLHEPNDAACAIQCTSFTSAEQIKCAAYQFDPSVTDENITNCFLFSGDVKGLALADVDNGEKALKCMVPRE